MAMTTPSTLYENLSSRYVRDGFLGRFLIVESHIGRQPSRLIDPTEPPADALAWAREHASARAGDLDADSYDMPPAAVLVPFHRDCREALRACDADMIGLMDDHEQFGLEAMFGRTKEIAQRIALIVARSRGEDQISLPSLQWGIDYATFYALRTVTALRRSMSDGPFEAACKAVLEQIEASGLRGVTERELSRSVRTFANLEPRKRKEVFDALAADHGILCRNQAEGQRGRPRMAWFRPPE